MRSPSFRKTWISFLVLTAGASAQGPGAGHGWVGAPEARARFLGPEGGMAGGTVKNAPYSADIVTETTQTLADGNHVRQTAGAKFYRDSEGRTRSEQSVNLGGLAASANLPPMVFINDPVAGVHYALNTQDRTASKSTWMARARGGPGGRSRDQAQIQAGRPRQRRSNPNLKTEALGRQTIEGLEADGTRITLTVPAGQMGNELPIQAVTERWYSPELQTEVLYKHSDPRTGETVRKLANISRSEPPRTMFEPPADYKVTESAGRMLRGGPGPGSRN
jgi:hypothetical protein